MLTREQAVEEVRRHYDDDWASKARSRAEKLSGEQQRTALLLLEGWEFARNRTPEEMDAIRRRQVETAEFLDEAPPTVLRSVLETCHPTLGRSLAHWWTWARSNQRLRNGNVFPDHPELTREQRYGLLWNLIATYGGYPVDAPWVAQWVGYQVGFGGDVTDLLLASLDDEVDGDEVYDILIQTIKGEHPIAVMGNHVLSILTRAARPDGWELVEGMLVGAKRQESLRSSILACVPNAHPESFRRLLRIIVDEKMLRFGAVLRAVGQWVGVSTSAEDEQAAAEWLDLFIEVSDLTSQEVLQADSAAVLELALIGLGRRDASAALDIAVEVAQQPDRERELRTLAARWLGSCGVPVTNVLETLAADADPWVAAPAIEMLRFPLHASPAVFDATAHLLDHWPDEPIVLSHSALRSSETIFDRHRAVASLLIHRGDLPFSRLEPWLDEIITITPPFLIHHLQTREELEPAERAVLVDLVAHRSQRVRVDALNALAKRPLLPAEAERVEPALTKKTEVVRRAAIRLLGTQPPPDVAASARRLWSGSDHLKSNRLAKDAAAELLGLAAEGGESTSVSDLARALLAESPSEDQEVFLRAAAGNPDDGDARNPRFGLFTEADRTPSQQPTMPSDMVELVSAGAADLLLAIDGLIEEHRDLELTVTDRDGSTREVLLGDLRAFPDPLTRHVRQRRPEPDLSPFGAILDRWWAEVVDRHRDADGLGLLRAMVLLENSYYSESEGRFLRPSEPTQTVIGEVEPVRLRHRHLVTGILTRLLVPTLSEAEPEQLLKLMLAECSLITDDQARTSVPPDDPADDPEWRRRDFRGVVPAWDWKWRYFAYRRHLGIEPSDERLGQLYRMLRWLQQPVPESDTNQIPVDILLAAHHRGLAPDADLFDELLGLSARRSYDNRYQPSELLGRLTGHDRTTIAEQYPRAVEVADRLRRRVLEIELKRGDLPTDASQYVNALGCVEGSALVLDLLALAGSDNLIRGWTSPESKIGQISKLLRKSFPAPGDDAPGIAEEAERRGIKTRRLVELAIYAPQWATLIEDAIGWKGLADAVWWLHAHTKDRKWAAAAEVREGWQATIAQRTELSPEDLMDGAVDVDWFQRFHTVLTAQRWSVVYEAAKLSSSGVGHNRAKLFADAMLGELDHTALVRRIEEKRHQDSVRALGLVPLPKAKRRRASELGERYAVIRSFEKGATKFGIQRKTNEQLAARVALDNLARTAGYVDPQRFAWAMEEAGVADLKQGPVVVSIDDVTMTLTIDDEGVPATSFARSGKTLKNAPAKLRKHPKIVELSARRKELSAQGVRVRRSLERAMVRADEFTEAELGSLIAHPIVGPNLRFVVICDRVGRLGLPVSDGFTGPTGRRRKLQEPLRPAHTADLFASGEWPKWQTLLFDLGRRQPFKQVFRELYLPTETERDRRFSKRYDGHQVQPSQARALLSSRDWYHDPDSRTFSTTNHGANIVSHLELGIDPFGFQDGELPVVGRITFRNRRGGGQLPIAEVPAHVFAETMRDVDLVVSVAHAGGVDPETSQSTVEMRAALARETARVLRLDNVSFTKSHAMISGTAADYSLHLGSGIAHRRPGAALSIRAAPTQRRGRIFLPFADDDPKTAEIISILLLLAKDDEIQDPAILRQIR